MQNAIGTYFFIGHKKQHAPQINERVVDNPFNLIYRKKAKFIECHLRTKKSIFWVDFSAKNRFSVGLETILERKNWK